MSERAAWSTDQGTAVTASHTPLPGTRLEPKLEIGGLDSDTAAIAPGARLAWLPAHGTAHHKAPIHSRPLLSWPRAKWQCSVQLHPMAQLKPESCVQRVRGSVCAWVGPARRKRLGWVCSRSGASGCPVTDARDQKRDTARDPPQWKSRVTWCRESSDSARCHGQVKPRGLPPHNTLGWHGEECARTGVPAAALTT